MKVLSLACPVRLGFIFGEFLSLCITLPPSDPLVNQPQVPLLLPRPPISIPCSVPSAWGPFKSVAWGSPFDLLPLHNEKPNWKVVYQVFPEVPDDPKSAGLLPLLAAQVTGHHAPMTPEKG